MKPSFLAIALLSAATAYSAEPVTIETFVRAETDTAIRTALKLGGGNFGQFVHFKQPVSAAKQTVIRTNRDTLYSGVILGAGLTHLGRFSAEYRNLFGGSPTATLNRCSS